VKCHFDWEEREVFPYLPPSLAEALMREHEAIRRCGFPDGLVRDHARREETVFAGYCPAKLAALVEADHAHLDKPGGGGGCGCCKGKAA
jgi:hypothetical protein